jgi:2-C-methyl-D-erythritol 4-phosphate cytidylyltransferase
MKKITAIFPAAGAGRRFGGSRNKIFESLKGQPIFLRFFAREDINQLLLVVSREDSHELRTRFSAQLEAMGIELVEGGLERYDSVRNALAKVSDESEWVCVHDAVRPCVATAWIDAVFAQARQCGAAMLAYPVHGTLKKVNKENYIESTSPRDGLWEAQTPQVFRKDWLMEAYAGDVAHVTDDAQLLEAMGRPVAVVMGDPRNIKITTPADLKLAEAVIDTLP